MATRNLIFLVILFLISFSSCKKNCSSPEITGQGELIDTGTSTVDGPGFFIRLDNGMGCLKPDCLPPSLEIPGTHIRVEATYQHTGVMHPAVMNSCQELPIVHIIRIRRI